MRWDLRARSLYSHLASQAAARRTRIESERYTRRARSGTGHELSGHLLFTWPGDVRLFGSERLVRHLDGLYTRTERVEPVEPRRSRIRLAGRHHARLVAAKNQRKVNP